MSEDKWQKSYRKRSGLCRFCSLPCSNSAVSVFNIHLTNQFTNMALARYMKWIGDTNILNKLFGALHMRILLVGSKFY
jgi:hypothetical protein